MRRIRAAIFLAPATLLLTACNTAPPPAQQTAATSGYATESFTPSNFRLPEGSGCAGEVARWRAIMDNDYQTGNVGKSVYAQITREIDAASAQCAAGNDAGARAAVSASRRRHGYPG